MVADNKTANLFGVTSTTMSSQISNDNHAAVLNNITKAEHQMGNVTNQTVRNLSGFDSFVPKMDNLTDLFSLGCSTALVFGGLVPYIPQYIKIKKSGSSDGFSTYVCLTLLLANILRIAFWFGHRFESPLLIQSFVMIFGMMALMEICVRVRNRSSAYVIPSVRMNTSRARRSIIVTAPSSPPPGESALLPFAAASTSISIEQHQVSTLDATKPYHQQESIDIETSRPVTGEGQSVTSQSTYSYSIHNSNDDNDSNLNSFRDNESPILNNIHVDPVISQSCQPSSPSPTDHSYANGYLSAQRHKRSTLVKWLNSHCFWDWDDLFSYVKFLSYFTLVLSIVTYLLLDNYLYIETLGFVALFTEAILGMPQLTRNFQKKSTLGMSVHMVIMWLSGDLFKTLYTILRKAPAQFVACGSIQVLVDVLILSQVFWYRRPKATYSKLPKLT